MAVLKSLAFTAMPKSTNDPVHILNKTLIRDYLVRFLSKLVIRLLSSPLESSLRFGVRPLCAVVSTGRRNTLC
jgi:hypothetical protein